MIWAGSSQARGGKPDTLTALKEAGGDLMAKNKFGSTPLHAAGAEPARISVDNFVRFMLGNAVIAKVSRSRQTTMPLIAVMLTCCGHCSTLGQP